MLTSSRPYAYEPLTALSCRHHGGIRAGGPAPCDGGGLRAAGGHCAIQHRPDRVPRHRGDIPPAWRLGRPGGQAAL